MANSSQTTVQTYKEYTSAVHYKLGEYSIVDGYHTITQTVAEYPRGIHGRP